MNEKKGPYVPKEDIAFWYPVSKKLDEAIRSIRNRYRRYGQRPPGPYQVIEAALLEYEKNNNGE